MCLSSIKESSRKKGIVFNRSLHFTRKKILQCAQKKILCTIPHYVLDKKLNILSEACLNIIYLFVFLHSRSVYWKNILFGGETNVIEQVSMRIIYNTEICVTAKIRNMIPWFLLYIYHFSVRFFFIFCTSYNIQNNTSPLIEGNKPYVIKSESK